MGRRSALGGDDAHRARIRSRGTILTQMRNSLSRRTINNRDKGFMVARETAAIKVSGCFQSVNSVPPSRRETDGRRPGRPTGHPRVSSSFDADAPSSRRYRWGISVRVYTHVTLTLVVFASNHGIGCAPGHAAGLWPRGRYTGSYRLVCHLCLVFKIVARPFDSRDCANYISCISEIRTNARILSCKYLELQRTRDRANLHPRPKVLLIKGDVPSRCISKVQSP